MTTGLVAGAVAVVLLVLGSRALPSRSRAMRSAQEAADRAAPGIVRVTGAEGMGEAGGYRIDAVLVADPTVTLSWTGSRRCRPGGPCEGRVRRALANSRDATAERAALLRGFATQGLTVVDEPDVGHQEVYAQGQPTTLGAYVRLATPPGPVRPAELAARLDAAVLAWAAGRTGLLPTRRVQATVVLLAASGRGQGSTRVVVDEGRLTVRAAEAFTWR